MSAVYRLFDRRDHGSRRHRACNVRIGDRCTPGWRHLLRVQVEQQGPHEPRKQGNERLVRLPIGGPEPDDKQGNHGEEYREEAERQNCLVFAPVHAIHLHAKGCASLSAAIFASTSSKATSACAVMDATAACRSAVLMAGYAFFRANND